MCILLYVRILFNMEFHPTIKGGDEFFLRALTNTAIRLKEEGEEKLDEVLAILNNPESKKNMSGSMWLMMGQIKLALSKADELERLQAISTSLRPSSIGDISEDTN